MPLAGVRLIFVLRQGTSEWTCLPGPPPGYTHDEPGCFDKTFCQWLKDGLAGRRQHIDKVGLAYMYVGTWVPNQSGKTTEKEFHVGPHIMKGGDQFVSGDTDSAV